MCKFSHTQVSWLTPKAVILHLAFLKENRKQYFWRTCLLCTPRLLPSQQSVDYELWKWGSGRLGNWPWHTARKWLTLDPAFSDSTALSSLLHGRDHSPVLSWRSSARLGEGTIALYPPWALFPGVLRTVRMDIHPQAASFPKTVKDPVCCGKSCSLGSTAGGRLWSVCPSWARVALHGISDKACGPIDRKSVV